MSGFNENAKLESTVDEGGGLYPSKESGKLVTSVSVKEGVNEISISNAGIISQFSVGFAGVVAFDGTAWLPVEVQPDSNSSKLTLYINVPRGCTSIDLYDQLLAAASCPKSVAPVKVIQQNTALALSANHSAAGAANPITSFVHPSILYFEAPWNGATYWATATPWAGVNFSPADKFEDGHLFSSTDGATFTAVNVNGSGFANLTSAISEGATATDSRLVYDDVSNKIYHYCRYTANGVETIYRNETSNGTTWTNAAGAQGAKDVVTLNGNNNWRTGFEFLPVITTTLSPSILIVGGEWRCWCTAYETDGGGDIVMRYAASMDGLNFVGGDILKKWWPTHFQGLWHTDVQWDPDSRQYVMLGQLQQRSSEGTRGSTYSSTNVLSVSKDGFEWDLSKTPSTFTGQDSGVETTYTYKGCLVRTGTRKWRIASCFNIRSDTTNRVALFPERVIEFDRPYAVTDTSGVFIEPMGRFYIDTPVISASGSIQKEPAWSLIVSNATAQVQGGMLKLRRAAGASVATSGVRLPSTYKVKARVRLATLTSSLSFSRETGETVGFVIDNNAGVLRLSGADAGVAFTKTTDWMDIIQIRSPVDADSVNAISVTATTTSGVRTIVVSSSAAMVTGRKIKIIGAGAGGSDHYSVISAISGTNVVVDVAPALSVSNAATRVGRWLLELFVNDVKVREITSSQPEYSRMGFSASGGNTGTDGGDIQYCYQLPLDSNKVSIS